MEIAQQFLTLYGPLGIGWIVAFIVWRSYDKYKTETASQLLGVIQSNTENTVRMTTLLQERLPKGGK